MSWLANIFFLSFSIVRPLEVAAQQPVDSHAFSTVGHLDATESAAEERALLDFVITDRNFEAFRQIANYRHSARLDVLPGFPEDPALARSAEIVDADAGTRDRLAGQHLTAREYVLTGWALIVAHDPAQWEFTEERLTPSMRRNIAFVQSHRESVEAFLRD